MLNRIESSIVGFGGETTSESAAIDERTTIAASAKENRNFLIVHIFNPPSALCLAATVPPQE
jgi:hypothetical protein